jgi:hypothetical protein
VDEYDLAGLVGPRSWSMCSSGPFGVNWEADTVVKLSGRGEEDELDVIAVCSTHDLTHHTTEDDTMGKNSFMIGIELVQVRRYEGVGRWRRTKGYTYSRMIQTTTRPACVVEEKRKGCDT